MILLGRPQRLKQWIEDKSKSKDDRPELGRTVRIAITVDPP